MTTATRKTYVKFATGSITQDVTVSTLKGDVLGMITFYKPWKQHVFVPEWDTEFSFDCLEDIAAKVKAMNTGASA